MGLGIVCSMAWRAWHSIWYGLVGEIWCMVWPGAHGMIYGMAWRSWHGICQGLAGVTWYMVRPGGHRMVYGMDWRGMSWYVERHSITCFKALPWAVPRSHVAMEWPMAVGGPVHRYRTRSKVESLLRACSVHTYSSCSLWTGIVDREIVNLQITVLG